MGDRAMLLMRYILYIYVMYVLYRYLYIIILTIRHALSHLG